MKEFSIEKLNNKEYTLANVDTHEVYTLIWDGRRLNGDNNCLLNESVLSYYSKIIKEEILTGLEASDDNDNDMYPFDPKAISIERKTIGMDNIVRRLIQGSLILNPDFQRSEVWTDEKKSQLIESIMLSIPIPMFYVSADIEGNLTVVDGLQRLSTLRDFIIGEKYLKTKNSDKKGIGLRLSGLEFLKDYNGLTFAELPVLYQNRILETEFTFTIINPATPEEVRRNIFKRLNTGGLPLSNQEIRNALYVGPVTSLLNDLCSSRNFNKATCGSVHSERKESQELVLRYLSFMLRSYRAYQTKHNTDIWLSDTMIIYNFYNGTDKRGAELKRRVSEGYIQLNTINNLSREQILRDFNTSMLRAYTLFGKHAFRKSVDGDRKRPINKALFETWGVVLSKISEDDFSKLKKNRKSFIEDYKKILTSSEFSLSISKYSSNHSSVKNRYEQIVELINTFTTND